MLDLVVNAGRIVGLRMLAAISTLVRLWQAPFEFFLVNKLGKVSNVLLLTDTAVLIAKNLDVARQYP